MLKNPLRGGPELLHSICWCQWYKYHSLFQAINMKSAAHWKLNKWLWTASGTSLVLLLPLSGVHSCGYHKVPGNRMARSPRLVPNSVWGAELPSQEQMLGELLGINGCFMHTANQLDWDLHFISLLLSPLQGGTSIIVPQLKESQRKGKESWRAHEGQWADLFFCPLLQLYISVNDKYLPIISF